MIQLKDYMIERSFPEEGKRLFDRLDKGLSNGEQIEIDMIDVITLPSMFMGASFGLAVQKYGINTIRHNIRFCNITREQADRVKEYFNRFQSISDL